MTFKEITDKWEKRNPQPSKIYKKLVCEDERVEKCWETGCMPYQNDATAYIQLHLIMKDGNRFDSKLHLPKDEWNCIEEANEYLNKLK